MEIRLDDAKHWFFLMKGSGSEYIFERDFGTVYDNLPHEKELQHVLKITYSEKDKFWHGEIPIHSYNMDGFCGSVPIFSETLCPYKIHKKTYLELRKDIESRVGSGIDFLPDEIMSEECLRKLRQSWEDRFMVLVNNGKLDDVNKISRYETKVMSEEL